MLKLYHHNRLQYLVSQSVLAVGVIFIQHRLFVQPLPRAKEAAK